MMFFSLGVLLCKINSKAIKEDGVNKMYLFDITVHLQCSPSNHTEELSSTLSPTDKSLHVCTENKQLSLLAANIEPDILPNMQSFCPAGFMIKLRHSPLFNCYLFSNQICAASVNCTISYILVLGNYICFLSQHEIL